MPALSHFWIRRMMRGSPIRCSRKRIIQSWLIVSKLAINGDFRAQRALLTAVEGFENEDEEAAALDEYADRVIEQANDELAERSVEKLGEREGAASTAVKKMSYAEAADRVMFLLRMGKYAVK